MKRMTASLIATLAILVIGAIAILLLFTSRSAVPEPAPTTPPVTEEPEKEPLGEFHGVLNLYLASPDQLPAGAGRVELALVKASLARADGTEVTFFEGSRRLMVQGGVTEKILSERIPNGRWTRLKLSFSPAADVAYADGRPTASAVVERHEAVLSFDADVPVSRTLALFARVPLEAASGQAGGLATLSLSSEPQPAEQYLFGGFLLDPRDRGDVWSIASPSLAAAVKEDLGVDIARQQAGSTGFVPAAGIPSTPTPQ